MADKKKDTKGKTSEKQGEEFEDDEDEDDSIGSKILMFIVGLIIISIWLAIFGLIIKMDIGGFGSQVLYPILKDVPVLNKVLPDVRLPEENPAYQFETVDDAVARIKELEITIQNLKDAGTTSEGTITELRTESEELALYKANEAKFEKDKEKFYEEVVFSDKAPDINAYKEYYEMIEPENAALIYKQVVEQKQVDKKIEDYAVTYSTMKPAEAAAIFDTMNDDLALVGKILWAMDTDARGKILGKMDSKNAALVTKLMEP